jgi:ubiquinone/menaquinone biosynthesis C-methylase UbiE
MTSNKAQKHFDEIAHYLREEAYAHENTMNSVRLKITRSILKKYPIGNLLDIGCGGGHTTYSFLKDGWSAVGVDFSENTVKEANAFIKTQHGPDNLIQQASATDLSTFPDASLDVVLCLGVLYYIEDVNAAYKEIFRVLKPGGIFICSHQNELFDLFTFNKYTLRFFRNHVFPLVDGEKDKREIELENLVKSLITHHDEPKKHDQGSGRDTVLTYPENPLTFPSKMKSYGFTVKSEPYYHGFHLMPPLAMKKETHLKVESEQKQYELRHDWRGLFMAAHFLFEMQKSG